MTVQSGEWLTLRQIQSLFALKFLRQNDAHGKVLTQGVDNTAKVMCKHGVKRPEFKLREMGGRWGSCTQLGVLMLNPILVRVPIHCIRYVLLHELCHLRHHDHGPEFYRLWDRALPDWISAKKTLERWVEVLPVSEHNALRRYG